MAAPQLKVVVNNQEAMILQIAPMKISTEKGIFLLNFGILHKYYCTVRICTGPPTGFIRNAMSPSFSAASTRPVAISSIFSIGRLREHPEQN